jgi:uncharacterized protein (TIGR03435 family)
MFPGMVIISRAVRYLVVFSVAVVLARTAERPAFEVASVRRIADYPPTATMNGDISHGRLSLNNAHLTQMIAVAYDIQSVRIQGVPSWLSSDQFQILAKAQDPETTEPQVKVMLRSLIEDRFRLKFHWEDKLLANYTLRVAPGGSKVESAESGGVDRCARTLSGTKYELACDHIQIGTLANALAVMLRSPVLDQTGLTGSYNFTLSWEADDSFSEVPDALERFGLKLDMKKVATRVFVIDSVERPSEN